MDQLISGARAWWIIGALAVLAALAGVFTVQPLDRDEARYTQATAQMLETGNFIEINFQDDARNKKPVGIYWMQAAIVGLFSDAEARQVWAYRIPSVIGAMLAALGCFWAGLCLTNREAAFAGAALFAVSVLLASEGGIAKTDAMLTGLTTIAMAALAALRTGGGKREAIIFWASIGLGVLVKGPVTPMIAGLGIIALVIWERKAAWLKPLLFWPGPVLAALLVLPWLIAIQIATGGAFLSEALGDDLGPKLVSGHERHGGLPGFHLLLLSVLSMPFIFFLVPGLRSIAGSVRNKESDAGATARFLLAWIIPSWLVFELLPTKLPHYTLPLYPALALIAAIGWQWLREAPAWSRWTSIALGLFGSVVLTALIAAVVTIYGEAHIAGYIAAGVVAVLCIGLAVETARQRMASALVLAIVAGLGWHVMARGVAVTLAPDLDLSRRAAAAAESLAGAAGVESGATLSTYTEPSFVFLSGTDTQLLEFEDFGDAIASQTGPFISVEDTSRSGDDLSVLEQVETRVCGQREVPGVNYSRGDETVLIVRLHNCSEEG